jgi:hypothetical protein
LIGQSVSDGTANGFVEESELAARRVGVAGAPAWLVRERLIDGLVPKAFFEEVGREVARGD